VIDRPLRLDPDALDPAFALARRHVDEGAAPFTILAVATSAGLVRAEAVPGPRAPGVTVDAVCLLASITKPVVALGVMQLVAEAGCAWRTRSTATSRSSPGPGSPG
jgi:CubicO group peptidase (beta-lactamase class C family)